jgi:hypothetical protein
MDLHKILGELIAERHRLGKIIATLEDLHGQGGFAAPKKRGRKNMDAAARNAVSQRMKRFWAERRAQAQKEAGPEA